MLNNCSLRQRTDHHFYPEYIYDFSGDSMEPVLAEYDKAILDGDEISCTKRDLLPSIEAEIFDIEGQGLYVVHPFFEKEFAAFITTVNCGAQEIKLSFLNPDKNLYPDVILRTYEIKSMFRVCRTARWTPAGRSGCHCAVDDDWCGEGCLNNFNKIS